MRERERERKRGKGGEEGKGTKRKKEGGKKGEILINKIIKQLSDVYKMCSDDTNRYLYTAHTMAVRPMTTK